MRLLCFLVMVILLIGCINDSPPVPFDPIPPPPTEEDLRLERIKEINVKIDQKRSELYKAEQTAGKTLHSIKRKEGYAELHLNNFPCGDKSMVIDVVSVKLCEEECLEATDASVLSELGQLFNLYSGVKDERGHGTSRGLKVPGIGKYNTLFVTDSLGDLSSPYQLTKYFEVDTSYTFDTVLVEDENEGFNLKENGEHYFWNIKKIDTIMLMDTVATYYEDIRIVFGELANIENTLKQCRLKGDELGIQTNLMAKTKLKEELKQLHSLRSRLVGNISNVRGQIDKFEQELILHTSPESYTFFQEIKD